MCLPWRIHHAQRGEVAVGECEQYGPEHVQVVAPYQHRQRSRGQTGVAEEKERDE